MVFFLMDWKGINEGIVKKSRKTIYLFSAILVVLALILSLSEKGINTLFLANDFGYLSFIFISLALLVTPIRRIFPLFPFNPTMVYARRALGVSAFSFALLHFLTHFLFTFSGKIEAVLFANEISNFGISFGSVSLIIFFALFLTSTNWAVKKLGRNWFRLHQLVYVAYPFIIWHAIRTGADFREKTIFATIFLAVAGITIVLEAGRIFLYLKQKKKQKME